MIKKIYFAYRNFIKKVRINAIRKEFSKKATLHGVGHNFSAGSWITLQAGSTKDDVILEDHCEVFGQLTSMNHGKIIIHEWVKFGERGMIEAVNKVEIGKDTAIATDVVITDNNNHPVNPTDRRYMRRTPHNSEERQHYHSANAPIIIGENVWVGARVRICKGVTIGDNAVIAANSVVTHNVPANSVAAGNPAKIVKTDIDKTTTPIFPLSKEGK